jgi:hypothetical protein
MQNGMKSELYTASDYPPHPRCASSSVLEVCCTRARRRRSSYTAIHGCQHHTEPVIVNGLCCMNRAAESHIVPFLNDRSIAFSNRKLYTSQISALQELTPHARPARGLRDGLVLYFCQWVPSSWRPTCGRMPELVSGYPAPLWVLCAFPWPYAAERDREHDVAQGRRPGLRSLPHSG